MKITRSFFIDEWVNVNSDLTAEFVLESILKFCTTHGYERWTNLFVESKERKEVVEQYFDLGGFVLGSSGRESQKCSIKRVEAVFERGSREFPVIFVMMMKILGEINKTARVEETFGSFLPVVTQMCAYNPRWKEQLAPSVLHPRQFSEAETTSIDFVKRALAYLETSLLKSPNLFSPEIKKAKAVIESNLQMLEN